MLDILQKKGVNVKIFANIKAKLGKNKILQIAIVLILVVAMFVIYFSTLGGGKKGTDTQDLQNPVTAEEYGAQLEQRLANVLCQIAGAGRVDVMITLEGGPTYEIAYTIEERKTSGSGGESTTLIKTPVMITKNGVSQPVILSETNPVILGVAIVAQGAGDMRVKMDLLKAAEVLLKIQVNRIEIFVGKV